MAHFTDHVAVSLDIWLFIFENFEVEGFIAKPETHALLSCSHQRRPHTTGQDRTEPRSPCAAAVAPSSSDPRH